MDGTKDWWDSKTIWSALFTVITGILLSAHVLSEAQAQILNADAPALAASIGTVILGVMSIYGRVTATKKITKP